MNTDRRYTHLERLGMHDLLDVLDSEALLNEGFILPDSTHKQDDRAYVLCKVNEDPQTCQDQPYLWEYTTRKPKWVESVTFETVVDADEAFAIVQRRNNILLEEARRASI